MRDRMLEKLEKAERLARGSRWKRFWHKPLRYAWAQSVNHAWFPLTGRGLSVRAKSFFGSYLHLELPAGTDIYLTGCKTHDSELRLTRFLIQEIRPGDCIADIGTHFGFFAQLASRLTGPEGMVLAIEASLRNYRLLQLNTTSFPNIGALHQAVTDTNGPVTFYEFPVRYSEYNTFDVTQFREQPWFNRWKPKQTKVEGYTLDETFRFLKFLPRIVKIDVEGAEDKVIRGGKQFLATGNPVVIMEYLQASRHNTAHRKASAMLQESGYRSYAIRKDGSLSPLQNIEQHLAQSGLESDNIVFRKMTPD